jgi:DNA-binding beta-propeller fold protein YncE
MNTSISRLTLSAAIAATLTVAGCATDQQQPAPAAPTTSATAQGAGCDVNPKTEPMPTAEEYRPVPADARISVTMSGIPSGTIKPGDPPAEVDVTLCNDSPVDYPAVGLTTVLTKCSCATSPMGLPQGRIERFEAASGNWVPLKHPVITTGMDFLGGFTDVQPLPKGRTVTLRYRFTLDPSMTAGKGSLETIAVEPDQLVEIGKADLPFTVLKDSPKETPAPSSSPAATDRQSVVPFTGLTYPDGIAAAENGDLYLADSDRVVKLVAGSTDQTVLPFTGIKSIGDVAVDGAGNVYATDTSGNRVLKLTAGTNEPIALPFSGLDSPWHIAVDKDGNVYVTDQGRRVVRMAAGSNEQSVVPFTDLQWPSDIAVDGTGAVYAADSPSNRILKLPPGSTDQTEMSVEGSGTFTVDSVGDVYLSDDVNRQVLQRRAGSTDTTELPFTGLNGPEGVAVDGAGNVYVIDNSGFGRIVKMAAN